MASKWKAIAQSDTVRVLRIANYRLSWPALVSGQLGRAMWLFVSSYLIFRLTGSILLTQLVMVTLAAPQFALGIFSGTLADAYNRRTVMLVSSLLMGAVTFAAAILAFTHLVTAWNILALSTVLGLLFTVNQVTRRTFSFDVVGTDLLVSAMALDNIGGTVALILAPLLVGLFLGIVPDDPVGGAALAYLAIAVFNTGAGSLVFFVKQDWVQARTALHFSSALSHMSEGLKAVVRSRALISIMGITIIFNFFFSPHRAMVPVIGDAVLGTGPVALGLLGAAGGIGSLIGAAYLAFRGTIRRQFLYYWVGCASAMGLLAVFAAAQNYPQAFLGLMLAGIGQAWFGAMQATLVLTTAPEHIRGRIMGVLNMAIGSQTLGSLVVGILSQSMGPGPALLAMAVTGAVSTLVWVYIYREMREL